MWPDTMHLHLSAFGLSCRSVNLSTFNRESANITEDTSTASNHKPLNGRKTASGLLHSQAGSHGFQPSDLELGECPMPECQEARCRR